MDFSTLLTLEADESTRAAGVHSLRVFITIGNAAGLCLTRFAQELSKADNKSTSLYEACQ